MYIYKYLSLLLTVSVAILMVALSLIHTHHHQSNHGKSSSFVHSNSSSEHFISLIYHKTICWMSSVLFGSCRWCCFIFFESRIVWLFTFSLAILFVICAAHSHSCLQNIFIESNYFSVHEKNSWRFKENTQIVGSQTIYTYIDMIKCTQTRTKITEQRKNELNTRNEQSNNEYTININSLR